MDSLTYMKNIDITPKKLRMFLPKVKRLSPVQATALLYYSPNRAALIFYKAIKSAMANARQTLKVSNDLLQFKLFTVEEGNKLKRYTAGSRGSAKPFKKRYSHIKIILMAKTQDEVGVKAKKELPEVQKTRAVAEVEVVKSAVKAKPVLRKTAVKKVTKKKAK